MPKQAVTDFTLPATGGVDFTLYPVRSKSLVIYFYPKDSTPGCTTEAQQFRELYDEFKEAGSRLAPLPACRQGYSLLSASFTNDAACLSARF